MESDQLESTGLEVVVQGCGMATAEVSVSKIADKRKWPVAITIGLCSVPIQIRINLAIRPLLKDA